MVTIVCHDVVFSGIQAILFDKDGTLADSEAFLCELGRWRSHFLALHLPGQEESFQQMFGLSIQHTPQDEVVNATPKPSRGVSLNPSGLLAVGSRRENTTAAAAAFATAGYGWIDALAHAQTAFQSADQKMPPKADATPLLPGVRALLHHLHLHPLKLAIVSSDTTENVLRFVQQFQLESHFSVLSGSGGSLEKPDPRLVIQLCQQLKVEPKQTLVVGDSQADMKMGKAAAVAGCLGVTWGWHEALHLPDADVLLRRCAELQVLP